MGVATVKLPNNWQLNKSTQHLGSAVEKELFDVICFDRVRQRMHDDDDHITFIFSTILQV